MTVRDERFTPMPCVPRSPDEARAYPLDDGIWLLRVPLGYPAASSVNAVLMRARDGYVLVDCGSSLPPGWDGLERALALAGAEPGAVSVLVTTHDHSDHSGLAAEVVERLGCEFWRLDAPLSLTDGLRQRDIAFDERRAEGRRQGIPDELLDVFVGTHVAGDGTQALAVPDRLLGAGDVIEAGGGSWTVHAGPGHCASQLMLHDESRDWLIAADVVLLAPVPFLDWGHTPDPLGDHVDSILRVRDLGPALLVPGHGRPVEEVGEHAEFALGAALGVRDGVHEIVAGGPMTPYEVLCRFVPEDADLDTRQAGFATVLSALDHLERRGEVASSPSPDGARLVTPAG